LPHGDDVVLCGHSFLNKYSTILSTLINVLIRVTAHCFVGKLSGAKSNSAIDEYKNFPARGFNLIHRTLCWAANVSVYFQASSQCKNSAVGRSGIYLNGWFCRWV